MKTKQDFITDMTSRGITATDQDAEICEMNWIEAGAVGSLPEPTHAIAEMENDEFEQFCDWCAENWK